MRANECECQFWCMCLVRFCHKNKFASLKLMHIKRIRWKCCRRDNNISSAKYKIHFTTLCLREFVPVLMEEFNYSQCQRPSSTLYLYLSPLLIVVRRKFRSLKRAICKKHNRFSYFNLSFWRNNISPSFVLIFQDDCIKNIKHKSYTFPAILSLSTATAIHWANG